MDDLRLALRAFGWRRGGSLVVLAAAVLTVAAAALGPMYAASASESVLQDRLTQSDAVRTTIAFRTDADVSYPGSVDVVAGEQSGRGTVPGYGAPVNETVVTTPVDSTDGQPGLSQAVWRDRVCDHVVMVQGTCSPGVDAAIVGEQSAQLLGWKVGSTLTLSTLEEYDTSQSSGSETALKPATVKVVGTYRPVSTQDPYWAGRLYFPLHANPDPDGPATVESVFVGADLFSSLKHPTAGTIGADLVLEHPEDVRVADVPAVRAEVERYISGGSDAPLPTTGMVDLLDEFEADSTATTIAAGVVTAQLALLAWLLLFLVVGDTAEARGGEVALAKLRGLPARAVAAVALREPVVLLVIAAPLGLALAYAATVLLARATLAPGVPVSVSAGALVAVGIASLGGLLAAVLASRRMFSRPVLEQWAQQQSDTSSLRRAPIIEIVLAAVAGLGFVLLLRGPGVEGSPLAWVAPGLLVVAASLLLVQLARPLLGSLVRSTRASSRVGLFLGSRQASRRPAAHRLVALLAVTLGLATFAVDASAAAAATREERAGLEVGAERAVRVQGPSGQALEQAVAKADPDGTWAMAVASWIPSGGILGTVVGVQPERLAAVADWSAGYGPLGAQEVAELISPPLPEPVAVKGDRVRITLTSGPVGSDPPQVRVAYRGDRDVPTFSSSTTLQEGTHVYEAAVPCDKERCTFDGYVLNRPQDKQPASFAVTLSAAEVASGGSWAPLDIPVDDAASWRVASYTGPVSGSVAASSDGLTYTGDLGPFVSPFVQYADVPAPLPLVTTPAIGSEGQDFTVVDVNARDVPARSVAEMRVLPLVADNGSITSLLALRRSAQGLEDVATWQVWLGDAAPPDALERLKDAGILVDAVSSRTERLDELGREGPALALRLLLVCAIVGAVLAAGALAISVAVTGRRRSYELAALSTVGVRRPVLLRACVLEQALLLLTGLVVGVPVGVAVGVLAVPLLPQTTTGTALPVDAVPPALPLTVFVVSAAALMLLTAWVGGTMLLRHAVPDRLRESAV